MKNELIICLIFIFFTLFVFSCKISQESESTIAQEIDDVINEQAFLYKFNGIISINKKGKEIFNKSYYDSPYLEKNNEIKFTNDTKFMIGSITKQITAMGILLLQNEGKISITDPISMYIQDFPNGDNITIHDILTHCAGLPREPFTARMIQQFSNDFVENNIYDIITDNSILNYVTKEYTFDKETNNFYLKKSTTIKKSKEIISILFLTCYIMQNIYNDSDILIKELISNNEITPQVNENEPFVYSNLGYIILGNIIEKISGQKLEDFFAQNFFLPLGMTNTGFNYEVTDDFAPTVSDYHNVISKNIKMDVWPGAAGGLHSTVNDIKKWTDFLFNEQIMSSWKKSKLWEEYHKLGKSTYGYGMYKTERKINRKKLIDIHHNGYIMSYNSSLHIIPSRKITIIILSNDIQARYAQEKWINHILEKIL